MFEMNTDFDDVKVLRRELFLDPISISIFLWMFYSLDRDQVPACVWFNPIKWLQVFHSDFHGSCLSTSATLEARAVIWTLARGVGDTRNSCCKSYMLGSKWYLEQLLRGENIGLLVMNSTRIYLILRGFLSLLLNVCSVIYSCRCSFIDTIMNLQLYLVYYGYFQTN